MAHGERMEKGEDAAAEKAEDEDKDTTILLSDEEIEQFVTVTKGKRKSVLQLDEDNRTRHTVRSVSVLEVQNM